MEDWSLQVEGLSIAPPLFSYKRRLNKLRNAFSVITVIIQKFKFSLLRLGYIFLASTWIRSWGRVTERWMHLLLQWKNNIFIAREIKRLQLHAMDKNLTSLRRRNQWSQKQCWPFIWRPWVLKITDNRFEYLFNFRHLLIKDNDWTSRPTRAVVILKRFEEGRNYPILCAFISIVLDPAIIACLLKRKSRSSLFYNDLLFHFSQLLFHLLKTMSCSKQWKDQKAI